MLPENFIHSIQHVEGFNKKNFEAIHAQNNPITSIRLNETKPNHLFQHLYQEQVPWCNQAFYLKERPSFTLEPGFHAGAFYVQEASSMFLYHILKQLFNDNAAAKVLDVCAAPGGKSTILSSFFKNGLIVCNEVIKNRSNILAENISKWGIGNCIVSNNDPKHFSTLTHFFDLVVIDAPCSGSGLFRKDATAIQEWSLQHVNLCSQRQQRIIADILPSLKENGYFIYSTCSYSEEENEQMLDFIATNFSVESIEININPQWGIVTTKSNIHKAFGYRFFPDRLKGEGFFIAAFKLTERKSITKFKQNQIQKLTTIENNVVKGFVPELTNYSMFKHQKEIKCINSEFITDVEILSAYLFLRKVGTIIGELKGKDFVPHHELALSNLRLSNIATIELDKQDALNYLAKKEFNVKLTKGLALVSYVGLRLGWIKVLQNRINNYYPNDWRIIKY